jgi:hypothetical protein
VTREDQQHAGRDQFVVRKAFAGVFDMHQLRQQVGARLRAARLDELAQVGCHLLGRALGDRVLLRRHVRGTDQQRDLVRQALDRQQPVARNAQHRHDHQRWQRAGKVGDEIDLFALADLGQQQVGQRRHGRAHGLHRLRGQHLARQAPQVGVLRRIAEHHPGCEVLQGLGHARRLGAGQGREVRAHPHHRHVAVEQHFLHVVVASQHPGAQPRAPMHRVFLAQAVDRVRVGEELARVGTEVERVVEHAPILRSSLGKINRAN